MLFVIGSLLFLLSGVSFVTFGILLIIRAAADKGLSLKVNLVFLASSVVVGLISVVMLFNSFPDEADKAFSDTTENSNEIAQKQEDEAKAKAEKEKAAKKKEEEEKKKIEEEKAAKKKKAEAKKKAEKEAEEKKAAEKKKKEKEQKEKEKEKKVKKEAKKKKKPIEEVILEEHNKIKKAKLEDGYLKLVIDGDGSFSVNTMFSYPANDALEAMNTAFKDDKVDTVGAIVQGTLTDTKGNETKEDIISIYYDRDNFEEFDFENFKKMALAEPWRIYNESDSYYIHPAIYKDLKEKNTSNLLNGSSKVE